MDTPRTTEGRWWVFGPKEAPQFGTLQFEPETGLELEVKIPQISAAGEEPLSYAWAKGKVSVPDIIAGRDGNDRPVTLYGCSHPGSTTSSGLQTILVQPMFALLNYAGSEWHANRFKRVSTRMTLLNNWLARSGIDQEFRPGEWPTFTLNKLKTLSCQLFGNVHVDIIPTLNVSRSLGRVDVVEGHKLFFKSTTDVRPVEEWLSYIHRFRRMLTLFAGVPVYVEEITFDMGKRSDQVELFYINQGVASAEKNEIYHNMRTNVPEIGDGLANVIKRWYEIHSEFEHALDLYFATVFNSNLYANQRFLFLAQAIEVYHRSSSSFNSAVQSTAEFRARTRKIMDAVPDERGWLKEKLGYANQKTLAQRLTDVLTEQKAYAELFIDNIDSFSEVVRATRNYFTHYAITNPKKQKVADGADLIKLSDQLQGLIEICLFRTLALEKPAIERVINGLRRRHYFSGLM